MATWEEISRQASALGIPYYDLEMGDVSGGDLAQQLAERINQVQSGQGQESPADFWPDTSYNQGLTGGPGQPALNPDGSPIIPYGSYFNQDAIAGREKLSGDILNAYNSKNYAAMESLLGQWKSGAGDGSDYPMWMLGVGAPKPEVQEWQQRMQDTGAGQYGYGNSAPIGGDPMSYQATPPSGGGGGAPPAVSDPRVDGRLTENPGDSRVDGTGNRAGVYGMPSAGPASRPPIGGQDNRAPSPFVDPVSEPGGPVRNADGSRVGASPIRPGFTRPQIGGQGLSPQQLTDPNARPGIRPAGTGPLRPGNRIDVTDPNRAGAYGTPQPGSPVVGPGGPGAGSRPPSSSRPPISGGPVPPGNRPPTGPGIPPGSGPGPGGGWRPPITGGGGQGPPLPNSAYTSGAFPSWSTWNEGNPYFGGDPGKMATSQANRATDYGNLFQNQFGNAYGDARGYEDQYRGAADAAYGDLYANPGYNGGERDLMLNGGIDGGLNSLRASQADLSGNYLTGQEMEGAFGNPWSVYDAFDPSAMNDVAAEGTGATADFFRENYDSARSALNEGSANASGIMGSYRTGADQRLGDFSSQLDSAVDRSRLGISDQEVDRLKSQAGRGVAAQYGAALDQLQRQAEAAGNVSPLALTAARERLLRSQSVDQANAVNKADLEARGKQREAEQDISSRLMSNANSIGTAGLGMESDIANTGLNANQSMTGLKAGTETSYGGMGTNLGLNATNLLTNTGFKAGDTRIGQAQYADTNASDRWFDLAGNRQNTAQANQNTQFMQGMGVANQVSNTAEQIAKARIDAEQAARNYWAGAGQYQGGQANAAAGQQIAGAQTSLSGQGSAGGIAVGNKNADKNPIQIGGIGFTL